MTEVWPIIRGATVMDLQAAFELMSERARERYRRGFYVRNGFTEADSAVMRIDYDLPEDSWWL